MNDTKRNTSKKPIHKVNVKNTLIFSIIVVFLNSLGGNFYFFSFNIKPSYWDIAGLISAIASCMLLYSMLEVYLHKVGSHKLAYHLRISACLRIIIQPLSDHLLGLFSIFLVQHVFKIILPFFSVNSEQFFELRYGLPIGFISVYLTTMTHALLASLVVATILILIKLFIFLYRLTVKDKTNC